MSVVISVSRRTEKLLIKHVFCFVFYPILYSLTVFFIPPFYVPAYGKFQLARKTLHIVTSGRFLSTESIQQLTSYFPHPETRRSAQDISRMGSQQMRTPTQQNILDFLIFPKRSVTIYRQFVYMNQIYVYICDSSLVSTGKPADTFFVITFF